MEESGYESQTFQILLTIVLFLLLTSILVKYVKWKLSRRNMYKLAKLLHEFPMKPAPLIGHSHYFFGNNEQILNKILMQASNPTPESIWLGPLLVVHISRPEDLEKICTSPLAVTKSSMYNFVQGALGAGLFVITGSKFKKHKKLLLPTFNQKSIDGFVEVFVRHTNVLLKILETKGGFTDFTDVIAHCTLDAVCEAVMGVELNAQKSHCIFAEYFRRNMDLMALRIFNIFLHPNFMYRLTPMFYEQKKITKYIQNFTKDVIKKKREEKYKNRVVGSEEKSSKYKSFIDSFLDISKDGTILTEEEIVNEVYTLLAAGVDATSTETNYVLLMLAMFPEIQQKVYEEIIEVLGTDREIKISDLSDMVYLERVIKETMRIFPIAPVIARKAEQDIRLENHTIPKGAEIVLDIINTHRNPEYYKDPLKFDPDRFLSEEVAKRHPYSYMPFSRGYRKCLGDKFSYMLMKTLLSKLVRKFTFETPYKSIEDIRLKESIILRAVDGFPIKITARQ